MHSAAIAVSRCLSVRLSVTFVSWAKTNKDIFKNFSPCGRVGGQGRRGLHVWEMIWLYATWMVSTRRQEFMKNECEALPGVAYPGVRDNRSTINTKTGYDDDDDDGSQAILVFSYQTGWRYSNGNTLTGASNARGVWKNWRFSTNISLYLRNGYS